MNELKNILNDIPEKFENEIFDKIITSENFTLERIISNGHNSPENFWYDQEKNEFVLILKGNAIIKYDDGKIFKMTKGDYLIIPAHQKHRVEETSSEEKTIWLAIHF
ncbi:MAG: cupin domain-containing protein [Melioribacteraceae bacterium]|nr:cupin domain-containing protein [Melioribacteraceae bacterium]